MTDTTAPIKTFSRGEQLATEFMTFIIMGVQNTGKAHKEVKRAIAQDIDREIQDAQADLPQIIFRENPLRTIVKLGEKELELSGVPLWQTILLQKFITENKRP